MHEEHVWIAMFTALPPTLVALAGVIMAFRNQSKIEDVKKVSDAVHVLTNNNMCVQLKLNADLSRWKANQTKAVADGIAADEADKIYNEHVKKQAVVDNMPHVAPG